MSFTIHLSPGVAAALVLLAAIAIPCVIRCAVEFLGEELADFRRGRGTLPNPCGPAVRGTQNLDANGHWRPQP